jgi:hypothetical protein
MNRLEKLINEVLSEEKEKRDRCLRIADRKFDKPSAYKSGAVVRCRKGGIWKGLNEYNNVGPSTPKTYIVKNDGTYKEVPIKLLSKISNLIYDMGGGETNYYPEKNIVIVDNIPIEQFAKEPGEIKDEKIYVEYNLNQPYSFPKANKIIASQLVYNLDNVESFATTVNNSLKDNGTFEFYSDVMIKKDKDFLNYLYSEYGFGFPKNLNQWKQEPIQLKKGKFVEPTISYIYNITDTNRNTAKISVTKEGRWWKYDKIEGNINFKPVQWSVEPEYKYNDITPSKENVLNTFSKALETNIVDFKKLNENLKETDDPQSGKAAPYKSGAVVRCRKGDIWVGLKEELENSFIAYKGVKSDFQNHNNPMFFTKDKEGAEHYARVNNGKIITATINFKNPLIVNAHTYPQGRRYGEGIPMYKDENGNKSPYSDNFIGTFSDNDINEKVIKLGYDGIIINKKYGNLIDGWEILTFDSSTRKIEETLPVLEYSKITEELIIEKVKETLRTWFSRKGAPGKKGGWVDCNSPIRKDGKIKGYKACGREKGETRSKYPSCRPTPAKCKDKGKGKTWGKTK